MIQVNCSVDLDNAVYGVNDIEVVRIHIAIQKMMKIISFIE